MRARHLLHARPVLDERAGEGSNAAGEARTEHDPLSADVGTPDMDSVALNARYTSWSCPQLYNVCTRINGSTVGFGFDGKFYYLAQVNWAVVELMPVPAPQQK